MPRTIVTKQFVCILLFSLSLSLILNVITLLDWFNAPEYKLGSLTRNVEMSISFSATQKQVITLPKGLTVRNATPRGFARISLLAPYRFSIYIADSEDDLVDYSKEPEMDELYFTTRTSTGKF
jgi:hypothetical protein